MPELPEVETIVRGLQKTTVNKIITDITINLIKVTNVPAAKFRECTIKARIKSVARRAKIIIIHLSNEYSLGIHLKIAGRLLCLKNETPIEKHTHLILHLGNGYDLRFWDLRQFGYVRIFPTDKLAAGLELDKFGPEPLESSFTLERFNEILGTRPKGRIKPLLMNQEFIAGIGNIYADEILYRSRIHPLRSVNTLKSVEIKRVFENIKEILTKAIKEKGTSVDLYVDLEGRTGNYAKYLKAYGREDEPCGRCSTPLKRIKIGSRSAYFCPRCQR